MVPSGATGIIDPMIVDLVPYEEGTALGGIKKDALSALVRLLSKKLGLTIGYNARRFPLEEAPLLAPFALGETLRTSGVIMSFDLIKNRADEPRFFGWTAICNVPNRHLVAGASFENDTSALMATLAEGLERYIWLTADDYFIDPTYATERDIARKGAFIAPSAWVGFTDLERATAPEKTLHADARYLWIRAKSLITGANIYIPAQIVSATASARAHSQIREPIIRFGNTNGLATWPTQMGAQIAGISEIIEREAYMIMWLNQLTLPRIDLSGPSESDAALARALAQCERYRIKVHAVQLLTDAPAHAVCVVLEDESGTAPRFTIGLKAHRSLTQAIQKALTEALRARRGYRIFSESGKAWDAGTPVDEIGHRDRAYYWAESANAEHLSFLIQGAYKNIERTPWESDSDAEYFKRLVAWCKGNHLECVSVSLGRSQKNPTPLHIEMVAMPDLQPTYLREVERTFGGTRWRSIPEQYGYTPRGAPFAERPHPFS